ncbi:unnamed protein product, partial [Strongylus vulgaris]
APCGGGVSQRTRECIGLCDAKLATESRPCNIGPCCEWSPWSPWSLCSVTCGRGGSSHRVRECSCGVGCIGKFNEVTNCDSSIPCVIPLS